ncbi:MAG: hypothetical protein M1524_03380 [Patescibacteria group bacterium]|nr:hypothetical protein [Patescibacteria group bacterium]
MERLRSNSQGENNARIFRSPIEYAHAFAGFRSSLKREVVSSDLDLPSQQKAIKFLRSFYDLSVKGILYRIPPIILNEPGFLGTNSRNERTGVALFTCLVCVVDDIIDSPDFPTFSSPEAFKEFLLTRQIALKGPKNKEEPNSISVGEIKDLLLLLYDPKRQNIINGFFDNATRNHLEYSVKEPGDYGYDYAFSYRRATTGLAAETARELAGIEKDTFVISDGKRGTAAQLIDDAFDILDDAVNKRINLWIGMAKDVGEIGILLNLMRDKGGFLRGRKIRRNMPKTLEKYMQVLENELGVIANPSGVAVHRLFAKFI